MLVSVLLGIALVLVPGFVILWALGFGPRTSVAAAPALSAAYLGVMGVVYGALGVFSNVLSLSLPLVVLAVLVLLVRNAGKRKVAHAGKNNVLEVPHQVFTWGVIALYVGIGLLTGYYVFVRSIPFSDGMIQSFDVVSHVNRVRAFANSGNFSSFTNPLYSQSDVSPFTSSSGFYPSSFHAMAALLCSTTGVEPTGAINVMSYVFSSLVLPLSLGLFLAETLNNRRAVACGSLVSTAFVMFPWLMLRWGPLFPNMAGLASMLSVVALAEMLAHRMPKKRWLGGAVAFLLGVLGLGFLQPNAVFAMGVVVALYLFVRLLQMRGSLAVGKARLNHVACGFAFVLVCCLLWIAVVRSPFLHDVVTFEWKTFTYPAQAVVNVLTLAFVHCFDEAFPEFPQYVLGALVVIGFVVAASRRRWRWLCLSYLVSAASFVLCVTSNGTLKHLVVGPWYNDPYRVAAVVCLSAMPLAALGVYWLVEIADSAIEKSQAKQTESREACARGAGIAGHMAGGAVSTASSDPRRASFAQTTAEVVVFVLVLAVIYYPNYSDPQTNQDVQTAFGFQRQDFSSSYGYDGGTYTKRESDFVHEVEKVVDNQGVVINVPGDGSVVSYGFDGLHAYYREMNNYDITSGETNDSLTIRHHLSEITTNPEVQEAVQRVGAKYVLKLSFDGEPASISWGYKDEDWDGILSINDNTPGFETVLADGDLRLYRITGE